MPIETLDSIFVSIAPATRGGRCGPGGVTGTTAAHSKGR
jgi:hypothetical protein